MTRARIRHLTVWGDRKIGGLLDSMMPSDREHLAVMVDVQNEFFAKSVIGPSPSGVVALWAPIPSGKIRVPEKWERTSPFLIPTELWYVLASENQFLDTVFGTLSFNIRKLYPNQQVRATILAQIPLNIEKMRDRYDRERLVSFFVSDMNRTL